ncbi:MAG: mannose-1-phosphate guanylyltransferase/mannose-6-phosphate isomerase, partial [Rhodobacteraceae bacterium]|nr:mannose-1-phosphate guanylyltransferase/mannose-6-phosphate isomerase [Paracoccaceae bacterium]
MWPSSRKAFPKQFAAFLNGRSLFQDTLARVSGPEFTAPTIVTNDDFRFLAQDQAVELGVTDAEIILEPVARDTAPAILTAALRLEATPEALMLVVPSDHLIRDAQAFAAAVEAGQTAAEGGALVAFGVTPQRPDTGYGYLELAGDARARIATPLASYSEKPDRARAEAMLAAGNYLWNSGIFLFRVADLLEAYARHAPELIAPCRAALEAAEKDLGFLRLGAADYAKADAISIDYAVM